MKYWGCSTETSPGCPTPPPAQCTVALGDWPGGPIDRDGIEVDEAEKGHCFDEMWGIKGGPHE